MIYREAKSKLEDHLKTDSKKIYFLWGPRRSGKTTIIKNIAELNSVPVFNFDKMEDRELFQPSVRSLKKIANEHKFIFIDEVQNFPESTVALKILHDELDCKVIATGSSELRQKSNQFDSLAGRYLENFCLPLSYAELLKNSKSKSYEEKIFANEYFINTQIFGSYPEINNNTIKTEEEKIIALENLVNTYILKDVIDIYNLKNSKLALDILRQIALQIGSEVSLREISNSLGANIGTVSSYIEIFKKNYILIALPSFKTNARRAISKNRKIYFLDCGIRNSLVQDFRDIALRPDKGGLFENLFYSELYKQKMNTNKLENFYFYRENSGKEVDFVIETYKKEYECFELKSNNKKTSKKVFPIEHELYNINPDNYYEKFSV